MDVFVTIHWDDIDDIDDIITGLINKSLHTHTLLLIGFDGRWHIFCKRKQSDYSLYFISIHTETCMQVILSSRANLS